MKTERNKANNNLNIFPAPVQIADYWYDSSLVLPDLTGEQSYLRSDYAEKEDALTWKRPRNYSAILLNIGFGISSDDATVVGNTGARCRSPEGNKNAIYGLERRVDIKPL